MAEITSGDGGDGDGYSDGRTKFWMMQRNHLEIFGVSPRKMTTRILLLFLERVQS